MGAVSLMTREDSLAILGSLAAPVMSHVDESAIGRDGLAVMRIDGETVYVDTARFDPRPDERAVVFDPDGKMMIELVRPSNGHANWMGRRLAYTQKAWTDGRGGQHHFAVWIVGVVVERDRLVQGLLGCGRSSRATKVLKRH